MLKCTVGCSNVRIFAKAIHCVNRLSEEMRINGTQEELLIEAVNKGKTVHLHLNFKDTFFSDYHATGYVNIKLRSKSCSLVYRNPGLLEKNLDMSEMVLENDKDEAFFEHQLKHCVTRTFRIPLMSHPMSFTIDASTDEAPVHMITSPKFLLDGFHNLAGNADNVTMRFREKNVKVETDDEDSSELHSEFYFESDEFDTYNVITDTDISFSLKHIKPFLNFIEPKNSALNFYVKESGGPLIFETSLKGISGRLIVAAVDKNYTVQTSRSQRQSNLNTRDSGEISYVPSSQNTDESEEALDQIVRNMVVNPGNQMNGAPETGDELNQVDEQPHSPFPTPLSSQQLMDYFGFGDGPPSDNSVDNEILVPASDDEDN